MQLSIQDHPLLLVQAFVSRFTTALDAVALPRVAAMLASPACPELPAPDDEVRAAIRDVLRQRGFKPTGRSKPSSEYLLRAHGEGGLRAINAAVDAANAVSLQSGLPISVVDLELLSAPLAIRSAGAGESYVFNPTGQVIELAGLPCLYDQNGPCANAVKDAQRTKTSPDTRATLSILWSSRQLQDRTSSALGFYRSLLSEAGVVLEGVELALEH